MAFLKLGWRWPRPNDFNGPDERPLKDSFQSLQHFLNWPYVGLRFDGTMSLTGTLAPVPFAAYSSAASPFVAGDPYNLFRSATSDVQVPRDFDTWMLIGSAVFETALGVGTAVATLGWRINGVNADYFSHVSGNAASRMAVPMMVPVRKGDTIQVVAASTDANEDVIDAEAWMYFLPLA